MRSWLLFMKISIGYNGYNGPTYMTENHQGVCFTAHIHSKTLSAVGYAFEKQIK